VATRNRPSRNPFRSRRGAAAIQFVVVFASVILVLSGFAVDLGRLYLVRGELKTAADAMALAGAAELIGTAASSENAGTASQRGIATPNGTGNKYDFAGLLIGQANGQLNSAVNDAEFFAAPGDFEGESPSGTTVTGAEARYIRVSLQAEAPLIFFGLLPQGQERKTAVAAEAIAGISAPLCVACGILNLAVAAPDASDTANLGFVPGTRYTLGYQCAGPQPQPLAGTTIRLPYMLLDRLDAEAIQFSDETSQLYRIGLAGLAPTTAEARSCFRIGAAENLWATATPGACPGSVNASVRSAFCGLAARFDTAIPAVCESIAEVGTLSGTQPIDTDLVELEDYTAYTGNRRRILTLPIVDALNPAGGMAVLGFRQFLLQPDQNGTTLNASDNNARFAATYIGSAVPLTQGRLFADGCPADLTAGPGKVVLFR
jgi:Flp pilus assembly protein TadG